jgi:hypothetical protein
MKALGTNAVEREREPVIPVGRQQLLVGHGAECLVRPEARAGIRHRGGTDLHLSSVYFNPAFHHSLSAAARSTPFTFITSGDHRRPNPVEVLFTLIVVLRTVLRFLPSFS